MQILHLKVEAESECNVSLAFSKQKEARTNHRCLGRHPMLFEKVWQIVEDILAFPQSEGQVKRINLSVKYAINSTD